MGSKCSELLRVQGSWVVLPDILALLSLCPYRHCLCFLRQTLCGIILSAYAWGNRTNTRRFVVRIRTLYHDTDPFMKMHWVRGILKVFTRALYPPLIWWLLWVIIYHVSLFAQPIRKLRDKFVLLNICTEFSCLFILFSIFLLLCCCSSKLPRMLMG